MKKGRILALDLLRGYFLFAIIVDHLNRFPSPFQLVTGGGLLWVSAAEGFFIISGLLIGFLQPKSVKLWGRAFKLYIISVFFTILFTFWGAHIPDYALKWGIWGGGSGENFIFKTLTLQYVYGWADFLAYYAVFLLFTPFVFYIGKKFGGLAVITLSFVIWLFRGNNPYLAWQIFFMMGIIFGINLSKLESMFLSLPHKIQNKIQKFLIIGSIIFMSISSLFVFGSIFSTNLRHINNILSPIFDKNTVGFGRMVFGWFWFLTLYIFVRKYEETINKVTFRFLEFFGRNSLLVYGIHAIILFPINAILARDTNFLQNVFINIVVLGIIFITVTISHVRFGNYNYFKIYNRD